MFFCWTISQTLPLCSHHVPLTYSRTPVFGHHVFGNMVHSPTNILKSHTDYLPASRSTIFHHIKIYRRHTGLTQHFTQHQINSDKVNANSHILGCHTTKRLPPSNPQTHIPISKKTPAYFLPSPSPSNIHLSSSKLATFFLRLLFNAARISSSTATASHCAFVLP